ncbi:MULTISPECIES: pseudouridine synthase [Aerococcus]|uniref:Pseudouridine synthase n=1 Tax=Aerococcus sanguinicola TaxID=119206 RepID=A0A5N1GLI1_9LACT|nr:MULTISPECIES: pseudouridine synthase [Aerococcus]KAA9301837.1 rRNA pseudouridine synthase [Aerococcus sanguinicola]MDK6368742.1 pseudouridine synthase [Aerococcus sp. UMB9870]MDK6679290.1 pseudouridine synthase [Aerococcus sp. UMB8608]MDK6685868.1 pseudouridine synthase [Aerococcus sp. UMB8623]MDK6939365.1 pseudouridine synthase [Aerococcus sp. UMB8487]
MRLDKLIANYSLLSRKEAKQAIKKGRVQVNGETVRKGEYKIVPDTDKVSLDGELIRYQPFIYFILHKPAGYLSTTKDGQTAIVTELLPEDLVHIYDPFPVGRLDKDTEGLLLLTNDGQLSHDLLSPRKKVDKEYYAEIEGIVTAEDQAAFASGLAIDQGETCLPAELFIDWVDPDQGRSQIRLILHEGKFHQVKRMFQAVGKEVTYLKRIRMGGLSLDPDLDRGDYLEIDKASLLALLQLED